MDPSRHAAVSLGISAVLWFFTRNVFAASVAFATGVLVDIDHLIEYAIHYGWRDFSIKEFYQICKRTHLKNTSRRFKKLYLIFHSYEIVILLWVAALLIKNIYLVAFALGYSGHLILDGIGNPFHPCSYFIIRRVIKNFEADKLFRTDI